MNLMKQIISMMPDRLAAGGTMKADQSENYRGAD